MGTWDEMMARRGKAWNEVLYGYIDTDTWNSYRTTPDAIVKLVVDKINEEYGIAGGRMNGKRKAVEDIWKFEAISVKKIIHSGPCTIVIWEDGEKTIVRQSKDDDWDEYAAFCAAFCKRIFGSTSAVKKIIEKKTVPYRPTNEEKKEDEELASYSRDEIIAKSKEQADEWKNKMMDQILMYGRLTIVKLFDIMENDHYTPLLNDFNYGWTNASDIHYEERPDGGYQFNLPRPKRFNQTLS